MKYSPVDGKAILTGYGVAPVMVISNAGMICGLSTQTGTGSTSVKPRMVAGFEHLQLSLIDYTTPYILGNVDITGVTGNIIEKSSVLSPNPVKDRLNFIAGESNYTWEICNTNGSKLLYGKSGTESTDLYITDLKPGLYLFKTHNLRTNRISAIKFIKE
jgi:hypothetical protein